MTSRQKSKQLKKEADPSQTQASDQGMTAQPMATKRPSYSQLSGDHSHSVAWFSMVLVRRARCLGFRGAETAIAPARTRTGELVRVK
jgi:hypothetical protein